GTLLVTATGVFIELQSDLNTIWGVEQRSGLGAWGFIKDRLLSFAMVIGIGFLLLVSLVVSASLQAVLKYFGTVVPGHGSIWVVLNSAISFAVITLLFAMIFKVLPDVRIAWRDVWVGAATTAFLFTAGKFLIGLYLGQSASISAYGAAGSIVLILLWVYYSAQILFFGAELTQAYANRFGARLEPKPNARWIIQPEQSRTGQKAVPARARDRKARIVAELREQVESMKAIRREAVLGKRQAHHAPPKP
ncbi:MAG: YihY/virulence factor BrkB family protein, partial [Limisphaerales bacterium]